MADEWLGTDIALPIKATFGDVDLISGRACLSQDIKNRVTTPRGALWCHSDYGVDIYQFMHIENTLVNRLDLTQVIEDEVLNDPRVKEVTATIISWNNYQVVISVQLVPIDGGNPINLVIGYNLNNMTMEVVTCG